MPRTAGLSVSRFGAKSGRKYRGKRVGAVAEKANGINDGNCGNGRGE
jgi:hypothetical protein